MPSRPHTPSTRRRSPRRPRRPRPCRAPPRERRRAPAREPIGDRLGELLQGVGLDQQPLWHDVWNDGLEVGGKDRFARAVESRRERRGARARARPLRASAAIEPMASARRASPMIISRRRSKRSPSTPPTSRNSTIGSVHATPTIESAVGTFDSSYTCHAIATTEIPSPNSDTVVAPKNNAKSRLRSGRRIRTPRCRRGAELDRGYLVHPPMVSSARNSTRPPTNLMQPLKEGRLGEDREDGGGVAPGAAPRSTRCFARRAPSAPSPAPTGTTTTTASTAARAAARSCSPPIPSSTPAPAGPPSASRSDAVELRPDNGLFMKRTEVVCSRCGGTWATSSTTAPSPTGQRYCINSCSLDLDKSTTGPFVIGLSPPRGPAR